MTSGVKEFKMLNLSEKAPSIVKAYSLMYNQSGKYVVLALEDLTTYRTLYNLCGELDKLSCADKITIAINCCRAVAELHQMKVVHGDLNSENILIDDKLDVKLIDFDNSSIEG